MKALAIIPARGGSKRIPRKNIRLFLDQPIISYSIKVALQSGLFDEVMVSTDDAEIAQIAEIEGASVPFYRTELNSTDFATTTDVLREVIEKYKGIGKNFDYCCCIYPTSPFISVEKLNLAIQLLKNDKLDCVFPIVRFGYPIQRALQFFENKVSLINSENLNKRSQDLAPAYHDAGQFYWFNVNAFLKSEMLFTVNSSSIILSELEVQDIDNEVDWQLAELKYKLLFPEKNE